MIGVIVFLIFSLSVAAALFLLVRGRARPVSDWDALPDAIEAVDVEAFRNLTDPAEDTWLRSQLPPRDYAQILRERRAATADYLGRAKRNAAILVRLGQAAAQSPDPALAAAGRQLVTTAMRTRLYTLQATVRLKAASVMPLAPGSIASVTEQYQALRNGADRVSRLRSPVLAARMTAAM
ncbi:MAG TPA: hypothetical protein VFU76_14565 [Terriglobales bacterium]|nr:hypothetical protein [Terriglobales bacterium]